MSILSLHLVALLLVPVLSVAQGQHPIDNEALVLVMGPSGTGKTTFTNLATGSKFDTSCELVSCTDTVQFSPRILLDGRTVTLVDTPGFGDTKKSEAEVLKIVTHYLTYSYEEGRKPLGLVYMHSISDSRVSKVARRNFNVFRRLCGDGAFKNVAIVTNMWGGISEEVGGARERKLASMDTFVGAALGQGAKMFRHNNTVASAHDIIRSFFRNTPAALSIQHEIIDQRMGISDTAAWQTLYTELAGDYDLELAKLRRKDRHHRTPEDEQNLRKLEALVKQLKEDAKVKGEEFKNEKAGYRKDFQEKLARLEEQRRAEEAAAAERERILRERAEQAENHLLAQIAGAIFIAATGGGIRVGLDDGRVDTVWTDLMRG